MKVSIMKLLLMMLFLLLNSSVVFSELSSSTQKSTMINLFQLLQKDQDPYYVNGYPLRWNVSTDPCTWSGVTCSSVTHSVTQLHFSHLELFDSSFLSVACQINTLEVLDVSGNFLKSIPDEFFTNCGRIPRLKSIDFSMNNIKGPLPSFNNKGFTQLESLDLSFNSLRGSIGAQLNGLVGLKNLKLTSNHFNGSIPINLFTELKELEELELSINKLQGRIPEQLANCKNLSLLDLSFNRFVGKIPNDLSSLRNLQKIDLSHNRLVGTIPNDSLSQPNLEKVDLSYNQLVGTIPNDLFSLPNMQIIDLSYNRLVGKIPNDLLSLQNLEQIYLSHNRLVGTIPNDLLSLQNLEAIDLSYNRLVGTIPRNVSSTLVRLRRTSNSLNGSISDINFTELHNLVSLDLKNNKLSGTIPANVGLCHNLTSLTLARNQFTGELPTELGLLNLWVINKNTEPISGLDLSHNNLSGPIPYKLQKYGYGAFAGNIQLCGPPVRISCDVVGVGGGGDEPTSIFTVGFYVSMGLGFYFGLWGVCGSLYLKDAWKQAFFDFLDTIYNKIYVTIAIYVARF